MIGLSNVLTATALPLNVIIERMSDGIIESLKIFFITLILSMPLGLIVSFGRMSKVRPVRWIVNLYISIMRGTPLMLQIIAIYFGPFYLFGISLSSDYKFTAIIIAFVVNYAAYFAEIYRSGIESMPVGQYEAARLLGYNKFQTFIKIIWPQVIKRILPSVTNEVICLVKDTSLAFSVSYIEMFSIAKQLAASTASFTPLLVAGAFYYVFNFTVAIIMRKLEKKYSYYE
ncbi:MAG: amino acid ABC transporter permease [Eubacterium sp.]|nr:amino acid ABC transporter permease [Eubacterium sp.]